MRLLWTLKGASILTVLPNVTTPTTPILFLNKENPSIDSLNYLGVQWSDIIGIGSKAINPELESYIVESGKPILGLQDVECLVEAHQDFYDKVLNENGVLAE